MKKKNIIDEISLKMMAIESESDELKIIEEIRALDDINMQGRDGRTLLIHASVYNCPKILEELIKCGADTTVKDSLGYTPLHAAVSSKNIFAIKVLLANGAPINALDNYGNTPLFRAMPSDWDLIEILISNGADPFVKNKSGISSYDKFLNYPKVIAYFEEKKQ